LYIVYNIHSLGKIPAQFQNNVKSDLVPKFTVGVNDIPELEKKNQSYVACKCQLDQCNSFFFLCFAYIIAIGTPDSIFQIKSDLYDLIITLPTPTFHHPIKSTSTNKSGTTNIALSDLNSSSAQPQPQFKSNVMATRHNPADFTRFRIMWKQLLSTTTTSWAEIVASEPNDILGTTAALVTGIYYWLYEDIPGERSAFPSRIVSSWQDLFAGGRRSSGNQVSIYLNETTNAEESQNLLLVGDEQDAMEISNNEVFEVIAARASTEIAEANSKKFVDGLVKEDNEVLLG
jgi:hypothetical protein